MLELSLFGTRGCVICTNKLNTHKVSASNECASDARYVFVPNLAHFGNHFLSNTAHFGMPILE